VLKKTSSFKSVTTLQNRNLSQLHLTINVQRQLTQRIKALLPETLAKHVVHCVAKGTTLLLYTHSANWASQLRFYSAAIISAAGSSITLLQTKIITNPEPADTKPRKANIPCAEKIEYLRAYSSALHDHQLKTALLKLTNTLTRLSSRNR
jgi:hypothetical protein